MGTQKCCSQVGIHCKWQDPTSKSHPTIAETQAMNGHESTASCAKQPGRHLPWGASRSILLSSDQAADLWFLVVRAWS